MTPARAAVARSINGATYNTVLVFSLRERAVNFQVFATFDGGRKKV